MYSVITTIRSSSARTSVSRSLSGSGIRLSTKYSTSRSPAKIPSTGRPSAFPNEKYRKPGIHAVPARFTFSLRSTLYRPTENAIHANSISRIRIRRAISPLHNSSFIGFSSPFPSSDQRESPEKAGLCKQCPNSVQISLCSFLNFSDLESSAAKLSSEGMSFMPDSR